MVGQAEAADGLFVDSGSEGELFLIGAIEWEALGNGVVDLNVDLNLAVDGGADIGATFSGLTIVVGVPEPSAALFVSVLFTGLVVRRNRK